jgi:hypothetical protein
MSSSDTGYGCEANRMRILCGLCETSLFLIVRPLPGMPQKIETRHIKS